MLKKIVSALALTGLASGSAFALNDPGFENGNAWVTPVGGLTRVQYGSPQADVTVIDDVYGSVNPVTGLPVPYVPAGGNVTVDALSTATLPGSVGVGSHFGLIETCPANVPAMSCTNSSVAYSFNLGGPASNYGDYFLVRLMTADFDANYNDAVTVTYYGNFAGGQTSFSDTVDVVNGLYYQGGYLGPDSNWMAFGVPAGTNSISVKVDNVAVVPYNNDPNDKLWNRPIVAIDYAAAVTPVPEADATAMMLAGLGALGMMARRRTKKGA